MPFLLLAQTYAAVFGVIAVSAITVPPGQDVAVLTAGRLVASGGLRWWPVCVVAVAAVVITDVVIFSIARRACTPVVSRVRWQRAAAVLQRFSAIGDYAIVAARFIPGTRLLLFLAAGARGVRLRRFVVLDTCAAAVWVPSMLQAGAWLLNLHSLTRLAAWALPY
jgi:membrane protein DedA with SNARE-associated domain